MAKNSICVGEEAASDLQQTSIAENSSIGWRLKIAHIFWHGGSTFDAWLTASTTQVAQVLLTLPYSFAQMGLGSGVAFQLSYAAIGCWACYSTTCLYADYKKQREEELRSAPSSDRKSKHIVQWYEVLQGLLGPYWRTLALFFSTVYLFTGATIQLIACGSNVYYLNDSLDKRTWTFVFGACCSLTILIPTARNYRLWSFVGIIMTSYSAWYLTIASLSHGQDKNVQHSGPYNSVKYFTGATNMLYAFGGHSVTVEIMDAMWTPRKFKIVYVYVVLYILTLTLPSAISVYWAFGDKMLLNPNAFGVLPRNKFRDAAVVLMLIHQFIEFGLIALPIFFMWEKLLGVHQSKYIVKMAARLPVVLSICFLALMIPFFGPINSTVGALLSSVSVYIIPCAAHMAYFRLKSTRKNAIEQPPGWMMNSWASVYSVNLGVVIWVFVVGTCFGAWHHTDARQDLTRRCACLLNREGSKIYTDTWQATSTYTFPQGFLQQRANLFELTMDDVEQQIRVLQHQIKDAEQKIEIAWRSYLAAQQGGGESDTKLDEQRQWSRREAQLRKREEQLERREEQLRELMLETNPGKTANRSTWDGGIAKEFMRHYSEETYVPRASDSVQFSDFRIGRSLRSDSHQRGGNDFSQPRYDGYHQQRDRNTGWNR